MKANKANIKTDKNGNGTTTTGLANQNQAQIASNNLQDFDLFYLCIFISSCLLYVLSMKEGYKGGDV